MHRKASAASTRNGRRHWLSAWVWPLLAGTGRAARAQADGPAIDAWVVLSLPELASLPREALAERQLLQQRIQAQQEQVMAALRTLGAQELGRVQVLSNALAVRLPRSQMDAVRRLPGVRSVRVVRDVPRGPLPPAA